jgi:hypothetical protein
VRELAVDLDGRTLRFDGVSIIEADRLVDALLDGLRPAQLRAAGPEVEAFNAQVAEAERVPAPDPAEPVALDLSWDLPPEYLSLDVEARVFDALEARLSSLGYTPEQEVAAANRVAAELDRLRAQGGLELVRALCLVVDRFRAAGQVWGVGRGSSCASYVLFLLGVHLVDPVRYNIPLDEFLR